MTLPHITNRQRSAAARSAISDDTKVFHRLMASLLGYMQISPAPDPAPEVYVFTFDDDLTVRFFSRQTGMADVVCRVGVMANTREPAALLGLLTLNRHTRDGVCLSVGVDPASGAVTVWTRLPVAQTDLDGLVVILKSVLSRARLVQRYLSGRFTADTGATIYRKGRFAMTNNAKPSSPDTKESPS